MFLSLVARPLLTLPRPAKRVLAMSMDALLCMVTVWVAFGLRLDQWTVMEGRHWWPVVVSLALGIPLFVYFGLYRAIFRYAGLAALLAVSQAIAVYALLYAFTFTYIGIAGIPRTIGIIQPILLLLAIGSTRLVARYWLGGLYQTHGRRRGLPSVLIYGAGSAGRQIAAALVNSREMWAVGFVDDDPTLQGNTINGLPVFDPTRLPQTVAKMGVTDVLLAIPSASRARRSAILSALQPLSLRVRTLPGLMDLANGRVKAADIHDLEIEDLLGRDPVPPNGILLNKNIRNKVVLVTGAGGSIGAELCRQIVRAGPSTLLLIEISEYALYAIHQELVNWSAEVDIRSIKFVPLLASVQDASRMAEIIRTWRPHTVYHAAAYKHVPLVEHNPAEGIRNNVFGTLVAATAAKECGTANFVLISTDKAVRPTNVMGASKRLAEMVLQAMAQEGVERTRFSMVRFGNVLGSSGSVVPLFRKQIKNGGPITLTHAEVTRYFMTIPEAAQLVIQADAMANDGDVFVLDMGEPVRISDLAFRMVELSGLTVKDAAHPDGDIEIVVTGLRPGEKLYEELLIGDKPELTQHPRIMKAREDFLPWPELEEKLIELRRALDANDVSLMRRVLETTVSGYKPAGGSVDWIHLERQSEIPGEIEVA